jgi:hypothetical protein
MGFSGGSSTSSSVASGAHASVASMVVVSSGKKPCLAATSSASIAAALAASSAASSSRSRSIISRMVPTKPLVFCCWVTSARGARVPWVGSSTISSTMDSASLLEASLRDEVRVGAAGRGRLRLAIWRP